MTDTMTPIIDEIETELRNIRGLLSLAVDRMPQVKSTDPLESLWAYNQFWHDTNAALDRLNAIIGEEEPMQQ